VESGTEGVTVDKVGVDSGDVLPGRSFFKTRRAATISATAAIPEPMRIPRAWLSLAFG
jgi:hypothetical protein